MSSPPRRPPTSSGSPTRSPTKPTSPTSSTVEAPTTGPVSPRRSPARITGQRATPMDVDRDALRKKRAASPPAASDRPSVPAQEASPTTKPDASSIDDRPTKRLHSDSNPPSQPTSSASSPTGGKPRSPTKPSTLSTPAAFAGFGASSLSAAPASGGFSGFAALANKPSVFGKPATASSTTAPTTTSFGGGFGAFATSSVTGGFSALAASAPAKSAFASSSGKPTLGDSRDKGEEDEEDGDDDDAGAAAGDDPVDDAATVPTYQPVVHLEQQHVVTGEEDEVTVASERAKLFLPDADGKPKERGIGSVKVNVRTLDNGEQRARVLMRADGVHNVLVNAPLLPGMTCNVNERVLQFGALVDGKLVIHLFRFKTTVPCQAIAAAIRDNVPKAANGGRANGNDHDGDHAEPNGEEAV